MLSRCAAFLTAATLAIPFLLAQGQISIRDLRVQGNSRLKEAAIISASGLRINSQVSRADLDSAAQLLFATGLFTGVNYRFAPPAVSTETRASLSR
ncbi:MAG: hypothetical protein JO145_06600 [Acidobacteriaceae bacterium]|nr:hypothetical protein [Acidobacteriaceae bacterium]MBV9767135.1 hypothetical protein [Acidobacteriaceae bacterium]